MDPDAPTPPEGLAEAPTPPGGTPVLAAPDSGVPRQPGGDGRPPSPGAGLTGAHAVRGPRDTGAFRAAALVDRHAAGAARHAGADDDPAAPEGTGGWRARASRTDEAAPAERTGAHRSAARGAGHRPRARDDAAGRTADGAGTDGPAAPVRRRDSRKRPAGHGHGHGHGPATPASRRVRIVIACLLVPAALATLVGLVLLYPFEGRPAPAAGAAALPRVPAVVTAAAPADCGNAPGDGGCVALTVVAEEGVLAGRPITVLVSAPQAGRGATQTYSVDDPVELVWSGDPADPASYEVSDFRRGTPLVLLAVVFAAAVVVLGRWRGLAALVALGLTAIVLVAFLLPAILAGRDPLTVAVVASGAIMFGVLYLTHGVSARTSTAVLGTLASLLLIGLLGVAFAGAARLTGLDEDTANLSAALGAPIDGRGLVLAGLVIGALGALDDVTVTQTSAVWELRAADPRARPGALFGAAMRIGRDHVSSAVNTLVLAYAGAALPLLLLFAVAERGLSDALTTQVIATEVVRTLVGSIGIVASVPVTTALAVAVSSGQGRRAAAL